MSFGVIMLNQNMNTMQNYVIWTQITEDVYEDLACHIEKRFGTSNYEVNRPLPEGKSTKAIRLMRDKSGGKTMAEFVALRPKTYFYLMNDTKNV